MYHNHKDHSHVSELSASIHENHFDSVPIEYVPYSEEEMALLQLLAKRQEEEFMTLED